MKLICRVIFSLLLAVTSHLPAAGPAGKTQQLTAPDQVPDGLAKSDWSGICQAYEAGHHAFQPVEGGWQARNPGQQWRTLFDGRGFLVEPAGGGWKWGLELQSYGFEGKEHPIGSKPAVRAEGRRLTYAWTTEIEEWFVNDASGLEHGFTVHERPAEDPSLDSKLSTLNFLLTVRGGLSPAIATDGQAVAFRDIFGATVLHYAGLMVWDADGKNLPSHFAPAEGGGLRLLVDERGSRYPITVDPMVQQARLLAFNRQPSDLFGASVAVSGDITVVGAPNEDGSGTGVNPASDEGKTDSGAVYVFVRSGTTWSQQAYLKASNSGSGDNFGSSVAVFGATLFVGAPNEDGSGTGVNPASDEGKTDSGAVYVFVQSGTTWSQQAYLKASNSGSGDTFGSSVAASGDTLVVGASQEDGSGIGVNPMSNEGAQDAGAAYVFERSGTNWIQQAYLKASNTGAVNNFGRSVSVSGDTTVVGAAGATHVYVRSGAAWNQQALLNASGAVAVSGDTAVAGSAVFVRTGANWSQQALLAASNADPGDMFGFSVAVSGDIVVMGAPNEDTWGGSVNGPIDEGMPDSGAAYVFVRNGTNWSQQAFLKGSADYFAYFGHSVAVSGDTVVVGAWKGGPETPDSGGANIFAGFGPTTAPHIALAASGVNIADGGFQGFGPVNIGTTSSITFTIRNTGAADLMGLVVSKDGENQGDFTVSLLSGTSIPVGDGTVTFSVNFSPSASGLRSATIHIGSNVIGPGNPFDITLNGTGIVPIPVINTHPGSTTVTRGQQAGFAVEATGWNLSYQWLKDSEPISGATASTYTIPSTLASDAGNYSVEVSNEGGTVTSNPAMLTVHVPPGFTQPLPNITASQGQSVILIPSSEGTGLLTWQWRKDGMNIPGATSSSNFIPNAQPWHTGNYSVVASNGIGSATSANAAVGVLPFPFNVWQGLMAYYPLNVAQPGRDYGLLGFHATDQGTAAASDSWGRNDGARRFVASESDGMITGSGALFHSQANFTWSAWVKTSGIYSGASTRIISTEGPDGSGLAGFGLYANSNGRFGAGLIWGGGGQGFESAAAYPANVWRHLAATYDGSRLRLYVDGAQAGNRLYTGVTLASDSPLYIGKYRTNADGTTGGHFDGWLDDVRFYNRVLPPADLTQLRASDDGMDLDNDGLGDAWEARFGFSPLANEGNGDADGDGMTNREEYLAGTNPLSAASNFSVPQLMELPGINVLNLSWHGSPARNYAVELSPDLMTWATLTTMPGAVGTTSFVVEAPIRPVRHYYRVVIVP